MDIGQYLEWTPIDLYRTNGRPCCDHEDQKCLHDDGERSQDDQSWNIKRPVYMEDIIKNQRKKNKKNACIVIFRLTCILLLKFWIMIELLILLKFECYYPQLFEGEVNKNNIPIITMQLNISLNELYINRSTSFWQVKWI